MKSRFLQFCWIETLKFRFYELKSIKSDGQFIQLHQQVNQGRPTWKIFRRLGQLGSLETEKRASGRDTQPMRALISQHCSFCMLFSSLNLSKTKKVTSQSYVKIYDLQLLFGIIFDISCPSRDISEKPFLEVVFCKSRGWTRSV